MLHEEADAHRVVLPVADCDCVLLPLTVPHALSEGESETLEQPETVAVADEQTEWVGETVLDREGLDAEETVAAPLPLAQPLVEWLSVADADSEGVSDGVVETLVVADRDSDAQELAVVVTVEDTQPEADVVAVVDCEGVEHDDCVELPELLAHWLLEMLCVMDCVADSVGEVVPEVLVDSDAESVPEGHPVTVRDTEAHPDCDTDAVPLRDALTEKDGVTEVLPLEQPLLETLWVIDTVAVDDCVDERETPVESEKESVPEEHPVTVRVPDAQAVCDNDAEAEREVLIEAETVEVVHVEREALVEALAVAAGEFVAVNVTLKEAWAGEPLPERLRVEDAVGDTLRDIDTLLHRDSDSVPELHADSDCVLEALTEGVSDALKEPEEDAEGVLEAAGLLLTAVDSDVVNEGLVDASLETDPNVDEVVLTDALMAVDSVWEPEFEGQDDEDTEGRGESVAEEVAEARALPVPCCVVLLDKLVLSDTDGHPVELEEEHGEPTPFVVDDVLETLTVPLSDCVTDADGERDALVLPV